jgi:hypothetical protein
VKTCIVLHLIASLHMVCERRYMRLYAVYSIYEDIYPVMALLQSWMFKFLLNVTPGSKSNRMLIVCVLRNQGSTHTIQKMDIE